MTPRRVLRFVRRRIGARRGPCRFLLALFGVLVEPGAQRLLADLDDDVLVAELGLAAEPRLGADVERLVHDVVLLVGDLGQRVEALLDVDVAGRAREVAAAGVADARAALLGGVEDRQARLALDGQRRRSTCGPCGFLNVIFGISVSASRRGRAASACGTGCLGLVERLAAEAARRPRGSCAPARTAWSRRRAPRSRRGSRGGRRRPSRASSVASSRPRPRRARRRRAARRRSRTRRGSPRGCARPRRARCAGCAREVLLGVLERLDQHLLDLLVGRGRSTA